MAIITGDEFINSCKHSTACEALSMADFRALVELASKAGYRVTVLAVGESKDYANTIYLQRIDPFRVSMKAFAAVEKMFGIICKSKPSEYTQDANGQIRLWWD